MRSQRTTTAIANAQKVAPYPRGGFGLYAFVAISIFAVVLFFFGRFYDMPVLEQPLLVGVGGGVIACSSGLLRLSRIKRNRAAIKIEWEGRGQKRIYHDSPR